MSDDKQTKKKGDVQVKYYRVISQEILDLIDRIVAERTEAYDRVLASVKEVGAESPVGVETADRSIQITGYRFAAGLPDGADPENWVQQDDEGYVFAPNPKTVEGYEIMQNMRQLSVPGFAMVLMSIGSPPILSLADGLWAPTLGRLKGGDWIVSVPVVSDDQGWASEGILEPVQIDEETGEVVGAG